MKSGKTRLVGCPLLSRLRRRFAPLRGTQRRYAALFFAPPGRYAPCALRAQPFWKHEKNARFPIYSNQTRQPATPHASRQTHAAHPS